MLEVDGWSRILGVEGVGGKMALFFKTTSSLYFVIFVITMLIHSCGTRFCGRINVVNSSMLFIGNVEYICVFVCEL